MARRNRRSNGHDRQAVASEAARLMSNKGLRDFRSAKQKAVESLGLARNGALPSNGEVEEALAEHQRIFNDDEERLQLLRSLRSAALSLMQALEPFMPRLVGDALSGLVTTHSPVELHVFADAPEAVDEALALHGVRSRHTGRRLRLRQGVSETFPTFSCMVNDCECLVTVLPLRRRGHAPLSPVDGRPMRRAGAKEVGALLAE
ncbi:MAG: hypothetical protein JJT85_12970 [Chromatiales bacterium]|nr:hypothetical protein [Chromatiales bacterium]